MLAGSEKPLCEVYDVAVLDLDGVVYVGSEAVTGAPGHLAGAKGRGMRIAYVTNNASRTPGSVGEHLRSLGIDVDDADVVTSAQAAARLLADTLEPGSRVFLVGGPGLEEALAERGLVAVTNMTDDPVAVVQGYAPDLPWKQVVSGGILVRKGLPWVASNTDLTMPTANGIGPGNGTLVRLLADFSDREPQVAGKPQRPLLEETLRRVGGDRPLMIGDRLDTDIEGARNVGWDSLLVLSGVTGLAELVRARPGVRPTYLAPGLGALVEPQHSVTHQAGSVSLGGWTGQVSSGRLEIEGAGEVGDWWRVAAETAWGHLDSAGEPVDTRDLHQPT